jgi:DNA-binding NarL/FixJ family response regulator
MTMMQTICKRKTDLSMNITKAVRILLVDDHPLIRSGIAQAVEKDGELTVCGEAASVSEALEAVEQTQPDLACVDMSLDDSNGADLIRALSKRDPPISCLVVSMHEDIAYVEKAFKAGARGYLLKRESAKKLTMAIHQVLRGEIFTSPQIVSSMLERIVHANDDQEPAPQEILTTREYEVFRLFGQGSARAEIAERLSISVKTVDTHVERIKETLHLDSTYTNCPSE